jgi:hypothetical protein
LASRFGWTPAALMELEWEDIELWLDQAQWTAKAERGETVDR